MRVLITGGAGQLAADLRRAFAQHEVVAPDRSQLDITSPGQIAAVFDSVAPSVVINTAASHSVDDCESDPESAFGVNAAAVQRLAAASKARDALFVHISTDYVFDGEAHRPYAETHPVAPINVYGASKAAGEMAVRATTPNHLIVRTTGLYGLAGRHTRRGNFVETMLRLAAGSQPISVVQDQVLTPSYTRDVADRVAALVALGATGTYHVTSSGKCSWYEFAAEIFRLADLQPDLIPVPQTQRPMPARRPAYSVLGHEGMRALGLPEMRPWRAALADYLTSCRVEDRQNP